MKLLYLSTAIIPSSYANSVHVMKMCNAFANNGINVTMLANKGDVATDLKAFYDIEHDLNIIYVPNTKYSVFCRIKEVFKLCKENDIVYTRNPIMAFCSCFIIKAKTIFEYHALTTNRLNKLLESMLVTRNNIRHVFITESLKKDYEKRYPVLENKDTIVLPDGADLKNPPQIFEQKRLSCGYIGSFQMGKGIELVVKIANELPAVTFHIVGGKTDEIATLKEKQLFNNIVWHGFLNQKQITEILNNEIDIALLPNQRQVLVGNNSTTDIGKYTSPMKLFEYMACGKAIIASDLEVIREVLDENSSILVSPDNTQEWVDAILCLEKNRPLFKNLCINSYSLCREQYTWSSRSIKVLKNM